MTHTAHTAPPANDAAPALGYWRYVPDDYSEERAWPLVLFLHGSGERGDDLALVKKHPLPRVLDGDAAMPFVAISPQCPRESDWTPHFPTLLGLIDATCAAYRIDPDRIYLTGLSMGGRGAWHLAVLQPQRFAALVPVCGRIPDLPDFLERLPLLRALPIWVFHGANDEVVPIENSETMVATLRASGGRPRYTRYPELAHDAWTRTYDTPELYAWLLAQRRRA